MSEHAPVRVLLVGAGRIAVGHLAAIDALDGVVLAGVVDPVADAARALAGDRDVVRAERLADGLVGAPDAELVVLCTPTPTHVDLGLEVLAAGRHVLIEKPVATSVRDLLRLADAARAAGRIAASGQVVRFLPTVSAAREAIARGALGRIELVAQRRVELRTEPAAWWAQTPDFLLHHWGSHVVDLVLDLLGERVADVLCRGGSAVPGHDGLDSVDLLATLAGGARFSVVQSLSSRIPRHDLLIVGSAGALEFRGYGEVRLDGAVLHAQSEEAVLAAGFRDQFADLRDAIRSGRPARADVSTVEPALAALEAAARSLRSGAVEPVEPRSTPAE